MVKLWRHGGLAVRRRTVGAAVACLHQPRLRIGTLAGGETMQYGQGACRIYFEDGASIRHASFGGRAEEAARVTEGRTGKGGVAWPEFGAKTRT